MNLSNHIRDTLIAVGVLSFVGILIALFRTAVWYSRQEIESTDIRV